MSALGDVQLHLVTCIDDMLALKRWLGERRDPFLAFDTETTGLDPYRSGEAIRLIQFGDTQQGWSVPWEMWKGAALEVLNAYEGPLVGHNAASFDVRWIEQHSDYRFERHRLHDTMIMAQIINPVGPAGLKPLSTRLIDRSAAAGQRVLDEAMSKNGWSWATVPIDFAPYSIYGAMDTVLTARLYEKFLKKCGPGGPYADAYDLEMTARHILTGMEHRGARVDLEYAQTKFDELNNYTDEVKQWGRQTHGISLTAPQQLAKRVEQLGVVIEEYTETGQKKMDKHQLDILCDHPDEEVAQLAQQVLSMRKAGKLASSYFRNFLDYAVPGPDGDIIHPSIKSIGARTGRSSIMSPALQQLPRGDATVRRAFIPREGNVLITTDFAQIEMRLMAHFSDDRALIDAFRAADRSGGDFFVEVGAQVYNDPGFSKKDKRRGLIKGVCYGLAYGAGVAKMAETAGVTFSQMEEAANAINRTFPGIKQYMRRVEVLGTERERSEGQGYITTGTGRRLACDEGKVYTLVNYCLQGTAAEVFKKSLIDLSAAGYEDYMILPVHDEVIMDIPEDLAPQALNDVPKIMQNLDEFSVEILAESEGPFPHWGAKYA